MCYWMKNPYTSLKWYIHSPPIYLCRKQWCREYRWCRGRWRHRFRPNEDQASWCELPFRRRYCSVPRQQRDRSFLRDLQREVPTQKQWSPINELKRSISEVFNKYVSANLQLSDVLHRRHGRPQVILFRVFHHRHYFQRRPNRPASLRRGREPFRGRRRSPVHDGTMLLQAPFADRIRVRRGRSCDLDNYSLVVISKFINITCGRGRTSREGILADRGSTLEFCFPFWQETTGTNTHGWSRGLLKFTPKTALAKYAREWTNNSFFPFGEFKSSALAEYAACSTLRRFGYWRRSWGPSSWLSFMLKTEEEPRTSRWRTKVTGLAKKKLNVHL